MSHPQDFSLTQLAQNAMLEYGFTPFFSKAALHKVKRCHPITFNRKTTQRDMRDILWISIDNVDSQDLDQLQFCERVAGGGIKVRVAIADVDHYVKRGDVIDHHASHNATSIYTGITIFPMLPEGLSYDLSSLLPNEDRFAIVVEYTVKKDGQITAGDVYQACVRNKAKLVYEEVGAWFENPTITPAWMTGEELKKQLNLQVEAAKRLRSFRQAEGMLEFISVESKPIIEDGQVKDMYTPWRSIANSIIEQFMIAANQTMVNFLSRSEWPTIQRIVRVPHRWGRIVEVAADIGVRLPAEPDHFALKEFLDNQKRRRPDTFMDLSLTIIKLMGRGEYEVVTPHKAGHGHFGLAVGHYTHSTAPNRRYIDLVIQRLVKALIAQDYCPYTKRELVEIAAWCTEQDTLSKKVERFMQKVAAIMVLQKHLGESFEGVVTGASDKGTYVRLLHPPAEGRVVRGFERMDVGQKVKVRLTRLDITRGFIDLEGIR